MRISLLVLRLILLAVAALSCAAAVSLINSDAGASLHSLSVTYWSGLLGMLIGAGAGISIIGAISPGWILANPVGALFGLVPLVALVLVRFYSGFDHEMTLNLALLSAVFALLALLFQPVTALMMSKASKRTAAKSRVSKNKRSKISGSAGTHL